MQVAEQEPELVLRSWMLIAPKQDHRRLGRTSVGKKRPEVRVCRHHNPLLASSEREDHLIVCRCQPKVTDMHRVVAG